jgi:hypothetical protein
MIKAWITLNPVKTLIFFFLGYIYIASYLVMVAERSNLYIDFYKLHYVSVCYQDDQAGLESPEISSQAVYYTDTVWLLMITFLTVGYGDFYPVTHTGRALAVATVLIG